MQERGKETAGGQRGWNSNANDFECVGFAKTCSAWGIDLSKTPKKVTRAERKDEISTLQRSGNASINLSPVLKFRKIVNQPTIPWHSDYGKATWATAQARLPAVVASHNPQSSSYYSSMVRAKKS